MLDFILCDDNENILKNLSKMLSIIFAKNNFNARVSFASSSTEDILNYVDSNNVDVILLDINLHSNITGLDVAKEIRKKNKNVYIIFTTAFLEYVMQAYKYKTFDFLAKPLTMPRLEDTIKRLFEDINGVPKKYLKIDNKSTLIDGASVQYISRDGMKLVFHSKNKEFVTYSSFNKIQNKLPKNFVRCHKSFIVNMDLIKDVDPVVNKVCFSSDSFCFIGPTYKKKFMEVLQAYGNAI